MSELALNDINPPLRAIVFADGADDDESIREFCKIILPAPELKEIIPPLPEFEVGEYELEEIEELISNMPELAVKEIAPLFPE
jgi:hypothetical protein